jgi:hypothetical protein
MQKVTADAGFRDRIKQLADDMDVNLDDILMQSPRRDPLNVGTSSDHKKAEWFADLWKEAVAQRQDDAIHIRGLHYVIIQMEQDVEPPTSRTSWDRYKNSEKCYDYLISAGTRARILGYVPVGGISDEKNNQERVTEYTGHNEPDDDMLSKVAVDSCLSVPSIPDVDETVKTKFDDIDELAKQLAEHYYSRSYYSIGLSEDELQPYHIEVWCEKALPDAVRHAAKDAGADAIVEGQGHLSYRVAHDFVQRVEQAEKPAVVLYLADFDPAGSKMPGAMASKISWLDKSDTLTHRVHLSRLAVTADQVDDLELPREPVEVDPSATAYQTLSDEWREENGGGAVELSALEADLENFQRIVRNGVLSVSDQDLSDRISDTQTEYFDEVEERIEEAVLESDLDSKASEVEDWLDDLNQALDDISDELEGVRDIANKDVQDDWSELIRDVVSGIDLPEVEMPEGDADPPANPLYDSDRDYLENVRTIKGSDLRD